MPFTLTQIRQLAIFFRIIFYLHILCALIISSDLFAQEISTSGERLTMQVQGKALKEKSLLPSQSQRLSLDPALILQLPPLDIRATEVEDKSLGDSRTPLRIGVARSIDASPLTHGRWVNIQKNRTLWLFGIRSPSGVGLRLHFTDFSLPPGAKIYIYPSSDPSKYFGPYEGKGIFDDGEFWSPTIEGETIILEFFSPSALTDLQTPFIIKEISHIYRNPLQLFDLKYNAIPEVQNCHLDATCYPDWAVEGDAVGRMVFNDSGTEYMCTGTLLDNIAKDFTPYFLTANRCISTERVARTLEVYWFYKTPSCNGTPPNLDDVPRSIGAKYLTGMNESDMTDFTLLQILGAVPRNLTWAGWTTVNPSTGDSVTGIHHPDGDYRRISFGNITESSETNYWSVDWSSGVTETGSTGSAIWNSSHQIVGQLSGGNSSCSDTNGEDRYGKFSESYPFMQGFLQGGADDTLEDNDTRDTAGLISAGSYSNLVVKIHDEDWYKVNVPANTCISITLSFTDDFGNMDIELYRGSETTPMNGSTGDENSKQVGDCNSDEAEDYFVHVSLSDGVRNTYRMTVMLNQLPNPDFESGPLNWVQNSSSERDMITQDPLAHSGSWIGWLGGVEDAEDYIYQDVSIPSNATNAYVSFWYWIDTAETTITKAYDTMAVEIRRPSNNTLLKTLVTLSNLDTSSHWILSDLYNVSEFIGQEIRLRFNTKNNDLDPSAFWIDDIGLWVTSPITEALSSPISPNGPSSGTKGTSYTYITGESYSNLNHTLEYQFDWKGDGATDLSLWGPATQSKTWNTNGSYDIKARTRCAIDTSVISSWSVSHRVTITVPTETITKPTTPDGPSDGLTGLSYSFSTGDASSNLKHPVEYQFDWNGDGATDLSSWGSATRSKTWNTAGTYHVRVRARCTIDTSVESAWSNILIVTIIKGEGPDLIGSWTSLTYSYKTMKDGQKWSIKGTLKINNIGNKNALTAAYVDFYLSDDDTYDEGDISLNKRISTGKIKFQKSKVIKLSYSFPVGQTLKGKYIIAVIDKDGLLTEINETNNVIVFGPIP